MRADTSEHIRRSDNFELSDDQLDSVVGGHSKFHYVEMGGHTYAIGHIKGQGTVMVKVT